jgi:hypothetical protein
MRCPLRLLFSGLNRRKHDGAILYVKVKDRLLSPA